MGNKMVKNIFFSDARRVGVGVGSGNREVKKIVIAKFR
jgi:putative NIF3 family GTP cyclohydrolase 1 type 2